MQEEPDLNRAEMELEAALASLRPAASTIDRDRLLYAAGGAAARARLVRWRVIASALAAGLLLAVLLRPEFRTVDRIVYVPTPPVAVVSTVHTAAPGESYFALLRKVQERGPAALSPGDVTRRIDDSPSIPEELRTLSPGQLRRAGFVVPDHTNPGDAL